MSPPVKPEFNAADAYVQLLNMGIPEDEATRHVMLRIANLPETVQADYLKDVDPGALASFGLGMADMMSFGLGDQAARLIWGKEALDTQQAALQEHRTAHTAGEIAGLVGPAAIEAGLVKAGKLAPSAIRAAVNAIKNPVGRGAAKVALNAATGAAYTGAQAAGRTEGSVGERAKAAARVAPYGAAAGVALPIAVSAVRRAPGAMGRLPGGRYLKEILGDVAGPTPSAPVTPPLPGLLGVGDDIGAAASAVRPPQVSVPQAPPVPALSVATVAGLRRLLANPRTSRELRDAIRLELARRAAGQ